MSADFLWDNQSNGYSVAPFDLMTTETNLSAITNGTAITSTVFHSTGAASQADTGSAVLADLEVNLNGSATPTAGGCLYIWFLRSKDGGSNYEAVKATASTTVPALPRPPDVIIPMAAAAHAAGDKVWATDVVLPPGTFKTIIQNMSGVTLNINHVTLAPKAVKY
jgi:hypothetical protein